LQININVAFSYYSFNKEFEWCLKLLLGYLCRGYGKKVADAAKSHDDAAAIENALKDAILNGFERFANKHKELTASLFRPAFP